jgi:hypothetical protein
VDSLEKLFTLAGSLSNASAGTLSVFIAMALAYVLWKREEKGIKQVLEILGDIKSLISQQQALDAQKTKSLDDSNAFSKEGLNLRLRDLESVCQESKEILHELRVISINKE